MDIGPALYCFRLYLPSKVYLLALLRAKNPYQQVVVFRTVGDIIAVAVFRDEVPHPVVCVSNGTEEPWSLAYTNAEEALPLVLAQVQREMERRVAEQQEIFRLLAEKIAEGVVTRIADQEVTEEQVLAALSERGEVEDDDTVLALTGDVSS